MQFSISAETDITVPDEELRAFMNELAPHIQDYFSKSPFSSNGWLLIYCPIIMSDQFIGDFSARSRVQHKKKELSCCPQLNHNTYMKSDRSGRRKKYTLGLLAAIILMRRAKFDNDHIDAFSDFCRSLAIKEDNSDYRRC